ncbi:Tryptophan-trna ligase, partial [Globisporangium splendens]
MQRMAASRGMLRRSHVRAPLGLRSTHAARAATGSRSALVPRRGRDPAVLARSLEVARAAATGCQFHYHLSSGTAIVRQQITCSTSARVAPCVRSFATSASDTDVSVPQWQDRVLSGIQPTGIPHLGNYCGAISKWVDLQSADEDRSKRLYSVVDLHAITVPFDPKAMPGQVRSMVAALLGAGLDPKQNILFKQSDVQYHTELAWYLGCITPIGWLNRMTQYKQKAQQDKMDSGLGLLAYPVLMAADILVYRATNVPVGEDQQQHLELARMIASTFNDRFGNGNQVFPKPFPVENNNQDTLYRIMSLREPTKKMSKSDPSALTRIELTDSPESIRKKIMKAQTDAIDGISYDRKERPGISNLLSIFSAVTNTPIDTLVHEYANSQTGAFKKSVADAVIAKICPIGERIQRYEADPTFIDEVLTDGAEQASEIAAATMKDVKAAMGL